MSNLVEYINKEAVKGNIQQVLHDKTPQFIASVTSLVNANEALREAEPKSILAAALTAAALDLPINQNLGFAYIIPYKNNKTGVTVAQFQMGFKGFIQLALRSNQFRTINVTDIREGEITESNQLTGEMQFIFAPADERDKLPIVGYVAYMKLNNGFEKIHYMSKQELEKHGVKYSKTYKMGFGLWKDEFDVMAKKTVVKLLLAKWAPMTTDMQKAQLADQAIIKDDQYEYPDNKQLDHDEVSNQKEYNRVLNHIINAKTVKELQEVKDLVSEHGLGGQYEEKEELLKK